MFNVTPQPTVLETIAWLAYAIPVLTIFLIPARGPGRTPTAAKPAEPAAKPAEPAAKPAEPAAKPAEPAAKPADSAEPARPVT
jgi:high-affinity iron transporter